ncbi:hypothetical protein B0T16DRAFT_331033, partial [Cercophora newfieldiana]
KRDWQKTYNTRDSLVVTDPTTSLALAGLSMGERTGSRVFQWVWSYVTEQSLCSTEEGSAWKTRANDLTVLDCNCSCSSVLKMKDYSRPKPIQ